MLNILVAEDDKSLSKLMSTILIKNGYQPFCVADGAEALRLMENTHIDLIISDIMMPQVDGFELISQIRGAGYTLPILIITARDTLADKEKGFNCGSDDYMTKPIDLHEMILRIKSLLRRANVAASRLLTMGDLVLNYDSLTVLWGDIYETLPKKEFFLLYKLLSSPGIIFTRLQLMDEVWGMDSEADDRTVDVHIKRLRDRFATYPHFEIVTVRGLGYKAERLI